MLLPGMHGAGELFSDFMRALPGDFASSARSYPKDVCLSYADHLRAIEDSAVDFGPFVMLGESFSSTIAIQFAGKRPRNLKGLVLSAGFATSPVRGFLQWIAPAVVPVLSCLPVNKIGARVMVPGEMRPGSPPARMRDAIAAVRPKVLMDRVQSVLACDALEDLRRIEVPVLYLQARYDGLVNSVCLKEMRQVKPDIEVEVFNSSHMILQEKPQEAAEIVARFVRRL